jgi:hypothetical protein
MSGVLPTAIKPILENTTNLNFFRQRPIVSMGQQRFIPSEQSSKYDTETAKLLGRLTNVSPSKIENLVSGYFGGSGRYVLQGGDLVLKMVDKFTGIDRGAKRPVELSDIPLIKGFVSRENQSESVNDFYENKNKVDKLYATYKKFIKDGRIERASRLRQSNPEIYQYKAFQIVYKKITDLNKITDKIISSKDLSDSRKKELIREITKKKIRLARMVNALVK